jgi:hypothetical protein
VTTPEREVPMPADPSTALDTIALIVDNLAHDEAFTPYTVLLDERYRAPRPRDADPDAATDAAPQAEAPTSTRTPIPLAFSVGGIVGGTFGSDLATACDQGATCSGGRASGWTASIRLDVPIVSRLWLEIAVGAQHASMHRDATLTLYSDGYDALPGSTLASDVSLTSLWGSAGLAVALVMSPVRIIGAVHVGVATIGAEEVRSGTVPTTPHANPDGTWPASVPYPLQTKGSVDHDLVTFWRPSVRAEVPVSRGLRVGLEVGAVFMSTNLTGFNGTSLQVAEPTGSTTAPQYAPPGSRTTPFTIGAVKASQGPMGEVLVNTVVLPEVSASLVVDL